MRPLVVTLLAGSFLAGCGGGGTEEQPFVEAERARATKYAADVGRDCTPPCRVHDVEPISPGLWRVHFGSATGYCVLIYLDEFVKRPGPDEGWDNTNCVGKPRPKP